jgi:hypothetical protein
MLEALLDQNPMVANNPIMREHMRSIMSNPDAMAEMVRPERLRAAMEMQRAFAA